MRPLLIAALLLAGRAGAADLWGVSTLASYHSDRTKGYNEWNRGAGIEYGGPTLRLVVGDYLNSFARRSTYAGAQWTPVSLGVFRFGAMAGAISGYEQNAHGGYMPLLLPVLAYERERVGLNVMFAPPVNRSAWVIGVQVKVKAW